MPVLKPDNPQIIENITVSPSGPTHKTSQCAWVSHTFMIYVERLNRFSRGPFMIQSKA